MKTVTLIIPLYHQILNRNINLNGSNLSIINQTMPEKSISNISNGFVPNGSNLLEVNFEQHVRHAHFSYLSHVICMTKERSDNCNYCP